MDRQKIFDQVVAHARAQKVKAVESGVNHPCVYRLQRGDTMLKCFLGCLMPDEMYNPDMENCLISHRELAPLAKHLGVESDEDEEFLKRLQKIHDKGEPEEWEVLLKAFANFRSLTYQDPES